MFDLHPTQGFFVSHVPYWRKQLLPEIKMYSGKAGRNILVN